MSGKRGGPDLGPEDRALWDEVKKSIKPLQKARLAGVAVEEVAARPASSESRKKPPSTVVSAPSAREAPKPPPLAKLDRRAKSRVARGRTEIDARLDLHGMTLERARSRLATFLHEAQARGYGLVLVITGKGSGGRGALKHEVPHWLALAEFRSLIIGYEEAAINHGGSGALYVRIRRHRAD
ncbi:MAG TPA: Smr/MutS family protein [Xanthobacteraceae bacterium]|nr:Smr/MutS family protein [Xanthobacteraceae bacterium]